MKQPSSTSKEFRVNVSIGDFSPLLRGPAYLFKGLQDTGVHGIELWVGLKSRWTIGHYQHLSQKYGLPIISLHQPLWAMTGVYFDEGFFDLAQRLGVQHVTCHPLPGISLQDRRMRTYFKRLAVMQKRTGVTVLIENLPQVYRNGLLHRFFPPAQDTGDVSRIRKAAGEFGLGVTLDTDHVHLPEPHRQAWFDAVLPEIHNIHLSSFDNDKRHLPLYMGDLQVVGFIHDLQKRDYVGSITLEIGWPKSITLWNYDFEATRKSIKVVRR